MKNSPKTVCNKTIKQQPQPQPSNDAPKIELICLGIDLHKASIVVTRIIDGLAPQPAQTFSWVSFFAFAAKQKSLAKKVYANYEAGAFGFALCRKLQSMGIVCYVVHPEKLDPKCKRVQNDRLDSRQLADKLHRYVSGNTMAMTVIYVPTEVEEQDRLLGRHRKHLKKDINSLKTRGHGLLLSWGVRESGFWWTQAEWEHLEPALNPALKEALEDDRALIADLEARLKKAKTRLQSSVPKALPAGFGAMTFALLIREICNFNRFKNRRQVASFTGLCGGVSSSGPSHLDLSINKAGNPTIRGLLIELAWRMVLFQPQYKGVQKYSRAIGFPQKAHSSKKKKAIVALSRQLMVDIWRWQTGRVQPEELGFKMVAS